MFHVVCIVMELCVCSLPLLAISRCNMDETMKNEVLKSVYLPGLHTCPATSSLVASRILRSHFAASRGALKLKLDTGSVITGSTRAESSGATAV